MACVFVVAMAFLISGGDSTPRAPYIDFFSSMSDGPVLDSNNDPALSGNNNSSTASPKEGVSTTPFPEDLPTYSPDAMKSIPVRRPQNFNAEQQKESSSGTESKGQFNLMDVNTWDSIPTAFFEPLAPSVNRGQKTGAPNQRNSAQIPVSFSEAGAEPSLAWDYSNVGMGSGADMGSGGTQDVFLPLADHSPGSTQADQPVGGSDWSAPPVSKDTAKYREEPTPKPVTVRFSDGESMARAILSGQVKKWEWTYSTTLGVGSSSGQGDRYDKSLTCCQRLPYICGVDGMCVIGIDECQEFCTCAANPHMPHCQKIIPMIKRTMAALEKKILAKVARELSFTTTTTARARINSNFAETNINLGMTDSEHFIIPGEQSAPRASQSRKPMDPRNAAKAREQFAAVTNQQPSALLQSGSSASNSQSTSATQNIRNNSEKNSQQQQFANTKPTISSKSNQGNKNVLAAASERKYTHTTATPPPKSVKTLINPSNANLKATLSHPASVSKNILASRDSPAPTQAPTTAIRKPQNPTIAETQPQLSPRNSKLPFTVDPDAVPTTKTTLLSTSLTNESKTPSFTNSPSSSRLTGKPTANNINNHSSIPATTYTVRNTSVTDADRLPAYHVNLKNNGTNATKTKSEMHSKEKETHASPGDSLVTNKSNITNLNLTKQNMTKQMVGTGLLSHAKRTGQINGINNSRFGVSGSIPRRTGANTEERKNIISGHPISTSRPENNIASTVTNKATRTKSAFPSMDRKDNAQTISTMFNGRTATIRTSTAMVNTKNASTTASNHGRFSVLKLSVDSNDTEKSALNKRLLGSERKATRTKAAVPSLTRKNNGQTSSTMFIVKTGSDRNGTAMANIKNASVSPSNSGKFSVSKMNVASNGTEHTISTMFVGRADSDGTRTALANIKNASVSPSNSAKFSVSKMNVANNDTEKTISTMLIGRTGSDRTRPTTDNIKNASVSSSNSGKLSVSKMNVASNDTEQSALKKQLSGSENNSTSVHGLAADETAIFKSSTMPSGEIPNISREATEIVGSNDTSGRVEKFHSLLGNFLRFTQKSFSTGRQIWASTVSGPTTTASTSNVSTENTTPETVASTSVIDQEASALTHQSTTNPTATNDRVVMFYLQSLNARAGQSTPKSKTPDEIQLESGTTREPVQGTTTLHSNSIVSGEGEERMAYTNSFINNHMNGNPSVTNEVLSNDSGNVNQNYTTIIYNDEDTMFTKNMNDLTNKETTKPVNKTLDSEKATGIDNSLPSMSTLPVNKRVHSEVGQSTAEDPNANVNENILEYDPSLMATSSDGSQIKPCNQHCQENAGVCLQGDDLKSHCVVVSEVCHQHPCINGYCVSSDGVASCECRRGWVGAACDQQCSVDCDDRSFCVGIGGNDLATCNCRWNYTGHDCQSTRKIIQRTPDAGQARRDLETWEVAIVAVATAVVAALLCVVSPYVLWKKQWLPIRHLFFYFLPFEDDDGKDFDAFISYQVSPRDERFVLQHLFPKLEKEMDFRLCLCTRDFLPGESVSSNTIRAINSSRRTVLILSPSYVTEWSKSEYSKARQEMLKIKNKVITIVLEDFSDLQDSHPFFRSVTDTAYSIKWPGEDISEKSSSISKFWKLLELSMPKKRNTSNSSVSSSAIYSSDVSLSSCSKSRFSSNTSSIYEEIIYSNNTLGGSNSDSGNSSYKTMQIRKLNNSLNGKSSFPDVLWNHQGRIPSVSLVLPHESRSVSSLSDDTGIESNTRSNSISSATTICPNHVVDIQIPRVHTVLGPASRAKF
ncbi:hypothetical protein BsWGS_03053 [Bradybaena similaris]